MKDLNQLLLNFNYNQNFNYDDFFVSKSNYFAFELIEKWPHWEKNILNIYGEKFSGKSHLANNFNNKTNERLLYSLFNLVDNDNKYLLINSLNPINEMNFNLDDLKSRSKNCLFAKIESPDDELMFAIILKSFSDRQIAIDKKLIDFIIKRIDRSYGKISEFIYKIDELSLKKKKPIDFKTIKEILKV